MNSLPIHHESLAEDRRARLGLTIARFIKWISLIPIIPMLLAGIFMPKYPHFLANGLAMLPIFIAAQVYPRLYRGGHSKAGLRLLVASIYIAIFSGPVVFPETFSGIAASLGVLTLIAYLLLGSSDGPWVAVIGVLGFAGLLAMNQYFPLHLFTPIDPTVGFFVNMGVYVFVAAGTASVIHLSTIEQDRLYRQQQEASWQSELSRSRLESMVQTCITYMAEVSNGNMLARLSFANQVTQPDEPMMVLARNLEAMTGSLRGMIFKMKEAVENLEQAAAEILAATTQQVSGASEQSTAISQTSVTVEEVRAIAQQVMQHTQELAELSQRSVEVARSGKQSVELTVRGMQEIRGMVERIAENILSLSERTQRIGEIISTVTDIASQSNMLALNASVEAARAGEHGRGFAVVAAEVRSLAEQSRQATAQVKTILSDIQKATNATVMVTEEGSKGVDRGGVLANQTGQAIEGLSQAIDEAAQAAMQMAAGGRQQMSGVDQVAIAIQSINQATVENLASTRQTEHAAQDLNLLAGSLTEMVSGYRVA